MTSKGLKLSPFAFYGFPKICATFFIHPLLKYDTLFTQPYLLGQPI